MTLRRVRLRDVDMAARWRSRSAPHALALLSSSSREAHEEFGGSGREIQRSTRRCWRWSDGFDFLLAFFFVIINSDNGFDRCDPVLAAFKFEDVGCGVRRCEVAVRSWRVGVGWRRRGGRAGQTARSVDGGGWAGCHWQARLISGTVWFILG